MKQFWYIFVAVLGFFTAGCSGDSSDDDMGPEIPDGGGNGSGTVSFDRGDMLAHWSDFIIIPSYVSFLDEYEEFKAAYEVFREEPDATSLETLRAAWLESYKRWQWISMYEIGPAEQDGLRLNVNTYPTDVSLLEQNVTSGNFDFDLPSNRDAKGFPAMDYLINGVGGTDSDILEVYTNPATGPGYLEYFEAVLLDVDWRVQRVADAWVTGYRDTFVANDGASSTASVDRFVNDYIFYYEKFLRAGKMGIPLGVFTGTPAPNTLEAYYMSGLGNELFLEGLNAVQDFFNGKALDGSGEGESLASYLRALNTVKGGEALDELINGQFNLARDMVRSLQAFKIEIEENNPPTDMLLAYDEVQRVVPLMKVDMVSAMSIAIDFVDADGD